MYKFTNGVVCYDEATRDKYIKSGMILVKEEPKKEEKEIGESETDNEIKPNEFERVTKRTGRFGKGIR